QRLDSRYLGGVVVCLTLPAPERDQRLDLGVRDVVALHAQRLGRLGWQVQHVATAKQLLGAYCVQDHARVDLRRDGESDPCWEVRFDQARDDVHGWSLGRDDEMDPRGASLLREAGQAELYV